MYFLQRYSILQKQHSFIADPLIFHFFINIHFLKPNIEYTIKYTICMTNISTIFNITKRA